MQKVAGEAPNEVILPPKECIIVEKGWMINTNNISEPWHYSDITCRAESASKAKTKLLKKSEVQGMVHLDSGEEVTYLTLKILRCPEADKVIYKGEAVSRNRMEELKKLESRLKELEEIINDEKTTHCYIKKRGLYYGPHRSGYTDFRMMAGIYEKEDAVRQAKGCEDLQIVPIDNKEHNNYLQKYITEVTGRLIK